MIRLLLFISCFLYCLNSDAQTKMSPHAKKMYRKGNRLVKNGQITRAILYYKQSLYESPGFVDAYIKIADILERKNQMAESIGFLSGAINIDPNYSYSYAEFYIKLLKSKKEIDPALSIAQLMLSKPNLQQNQRKQMELTLESLQLMKRIEGQKINNELVNLGDSINSPLTEYFPSLTLDESKMVFTRIINGANEDFYEALQDSNKIWHKATNAGYPPNTSMPDGAPCISPDGRYLFYTRCDTKSPDGIVGGGCDIYYSYYTDTGWSNQEKFGYTINTSYYEGMPSISSNNYDMYFVSNRGGGLGGMDIYVAHFIGGVWSEPINLGKNINTSEDETSPFIHPDNHTLYFASKGHPSFGGNDIFYTVKTNDTAWTKPYNLGPPINTRNDENQIYVNAYGNRAYISGERKEGKGKSDIYYTSLPSFAYAQPVKCIKGKIMDKKSKIPLKELKLKFLKDSVYYRSYISNSGDGSFELIVPSDGVYRVEVVLDNYKPFYRNMDFRMPYDMPVNYYKDIRLKGFDLIDTLMVIETQDDLSDSLKRFIMQQTKKWTEDSATVKVYIDYEFPFCFDSLNQEANKLYLNDEDSVCYYEQQALLKYIDTTKEITKAKEHKKYNDLLQFFDIETKPIEIGGSELSADVSDKRKRLSRIKICVVEYY